MKKLIYFLTICSSLFFLSSCDDNDGYSLGKFWVSRATVNSAGSGVFSFTLDDGTTLWPTASGVHHYDPKDGQRVYINYTILSDKIDKYDHYIRLNDVFNILTKDIVTVGDEATEVYGDDPVKIHTMDTDGGYLNVDFGFNYGGGKKHFINLVKNTSVEYPDDGKIYLEFRHNTYGDAVKAGVNATVSFPLESLKVEGKESVDLVIRVNTFEGVKNYEKAYNWKNPASARKTSDWTVLSKGIQ